MLCAFLMSAALGGTLVGQPQRERLLLLQFDFGAEHRKLLERTDKFIALLEEGIEDTRKMIRTFPPKHTHSLQETLVKMQKTLAVVRVQRQWLIDNHPLSKPHPLAPSPREKRTD